ncbi:hypothetical protein [Streptomyces sp. NRRL WC-3549]|uniref:hypothetical protein n=1 Tax=Streptomyces sp. NRRL WC-3549 TaxID=1463925 RepID=UPI0004C5DE4E|nr:hypothetical protein [Streptomyces sp. NRRL WC-3549]
MTDNSDDADRVFVRSKWGTNRYVYNPRNPVGRALIAGSLLFAAGSMYVLYHPDLFEPSHDWKTGELRDAVTTATAELSRDAEFGPGGGSGSYDDILRAHIAKAADRPSDGMSVALASAPAVSAAFTGGEEQAVYTVTAEGTDAAFCLDVHAVTREGGWRYASVSISVDEGVCPDP